MGGLFACPECGNPLKLKGLTPGRQVRCEWCRAWVEVPFLPRVVLKGPARSRSRGRWRWWRRPPRWAIWAWGGVALATLLVVMVGASRIYQSRSRRVHEEALTRLSESARCDEREGLYGPALASIEAALIEAARIEPRDEARLDALRAWRDRVAGREVEARLAALAAMAPEPAVGACLTLLARICDDPRGLGRFEETVRDRLGEARERWVEADLVAARRALAAGDAPRVLDLCERLAENADVLTTETRRRARDEADAMIGLTVARRGIVLEPIRGAFTLGSEASYASLLHPLLVDALRRQGYLPRPDSSFWVGLWDRSAPFHLKGEVVETYSGLYLESQNRTSSIQVALLLDETATDRTTWECRMTATTREPLLKLGAYQGSRLATASHRNPEIERLFYDDARAVFAERIGPKLHGLPELRTPLSPLPTPDEDESPS